MLRILFSWVLLLGFGGATIAGQLFTLSQDGRLPSGRTYHIEIKESHYVRVPHEKEDDGGRWGIDGGFPESFISHFLFAVNGKKVTIPRKLFQDISHVNRATVSETKRTIKVSVRGGDAAGSFEAIYLFKIPREIERIVRAGEMPDEVWEKTVWHYGFDDPSFNPKS